MGGLDCVGRGMDPNGVSHGESQDNSQGARSLTTASHARHPPPRPISEGDVVSRMLALERTLLIRLSASKAYTGLKIYTTFCTMSACCIARAPSHRSRSMRTRHLHVQ